MAISPLLGGWVLNLNKIPVPIPELKDEDI
jgi:hypothetical protein